MLGDRIRIQKALPRADRLVPAASRIHCVRARVCVRVYHVTSCFRSFLLQV